MDEDSNVEQKTWHVTSFRKRNVFRLVRVSVIEEVEGHSMQTDLKQNKNMGTNTGESGVRNLAAESVNVCVRVYLWCK